MEKFGVKEKCVLESERLVMRQISENDIDLYYEMFKCPNTTRFLPNEAPYEDNQIDNLFSERISHWKNGFGTFTITEKNSRKKIGYVGVERTSNPDLSDIRYGLVCSERGRGFAVEAGIECLEYTFSLDVHDKIYGAVLVGNKPSIKVLQKLGMQEDSGVNFYDGSDLIYMSITKEYFLRNQNWFV